MGIHLLHVAMSTSLTHTRRFIMHTFFQTTLLHSQTVHNTHLTSQNTNISKLFLIFTMQSCRLWTWKLKDDMITWNVYHRKTGCPVTKSIYHCIQVLHRDKTKHRWFSRVTHFTQASSHKTQVRSFFEEKWDSASLICHLSIFGTRLLLLQKGNGQTKQK